MEEGGGRGVLMMEWEGQEAGFVVSAGVATEGARLTWEFPWDALRGEAAAGMERHCRQGKQLSLRI